MKALQDTVDSFYAISEAQGWILGYTLERAMEALREEEMGVQALQDRFPMLARQVR